MALTNPIRWDLQAGTLGADITHSTQSTVNLGNVVGFPTLQTSNGDYVPITLVNATNLTAGEVVYMTQYTAGNSTGFISRGQETLSGAGPATTWASGGSWEHGPTAVDMQGPQGWQIAGNTTGTSAVLTEGTVTLAGGTNVTLSQSGNAITIQGPVVGQYEYNTEAFYSSSTSNIVLTQPMIQRIQLDQAVSFTRVDVPVVVSLATSATTNTGAMNVSAVYALYTASGSTMSPIVGGSSTTTYTWGSNSGVYSSLTGPRILTFPLQSTLTPGNYYMAMQFSTASTSSIGLSTTALSGSISPVFGTSLSATPWQVMSAATAASIAPIDFMVGFNSVSISNTTQTMQASQITMTGTAGVRANYVVQFRAT